MSETVGYEKDKCEVKLPGCKKMGAGYQRRAKYAQQGPWLDACEECARVLYEQSVQFQEKEEEVNAAF
jgi:hypothetical protein